MNEPTSQNPYSAPSSTLQKSQINSNGFNSGYDFSLGDVIKEAWKRVHGVKGSFLGAYIIYSMAIALVVLFLGVILAPFRISGILQDPSVSLTLLEFIIHLIITLVSYPFLAGIVMMGVRRAADQPANIGELFNYFGLSIPLFLTALLMSLLLFLGFLLLIIPGIYLSVSYMFAIPLVAERGLSPWQALETSRKAVTQRWFKVFAFLIVISLIIFVSAIPLGIGLIWTMPLSIIAMGVLYRIIFGAPTPVKNS